MLSQSLPRIWSQTAFCIHVCPPIKYPAGLVSLYVSNAGSLLYLAVPCCTLVCWVSLTGGGQANDTFTHIAWQEEEDSDPTQQQKHYLIIQKSACWIRYRESVRFWCPQWPQWLRWPRWPPAPPLPLPLGLGLCHTWCQSRINHWNGARQELTDRQQQLFISDKDWLIV